MSAKDSKLCGRIYYAFEEPQPGEMETVSPEYLEWISDGDGEDPLSAPRPGFWRRQFQAEPTKRQKDFDWLFGVLIPTACIYFDPVVFKSTYHERVLLGGVAPFAYMLSFTAIVAVMAWLLFGDRVRWMSVALAGLFSVSSAAALVIGIFLFPFSLIGLIILIGALGFTPLFTSFVFLRNAIRAFRAAQGSVNRQVLVPGFALAAIVSAVIPYLFNLLYPIQ
jgi:hypothetical protein